MDLGAGSGISTRTRTSSVPICNKLIRKTNYSFIYIYSKTYSVAKNRCGVAQEDVAVTFEWHFTFYNNTNETRFGNGIRELYQLLSEITAASIAYNSQWSFHSLYEWLRMTSGSKLKFT